MFSAFFVDSKGARDKSAEPGMQGNGAAAELARQPELSPARQMKQKSRPPSPHTGKGWAFPGTWQEIWSSDIAPVSGEFLEHTQQCVKQNQTTPLIMFLKIP